jgi:hypothetical protein
MIGKCIVRDKEKNPIGYFNNSLDAESFIERNDPKGIKGFYVVKN